MKKIVQPIRVEIGDLENVVGGAGLLTSGPTIRSSGATIYRPAAPTPGLTRTESTVMCPGSRGLRQLPLNKVNPAAR